jgi:hypothetical protein
LCCMLCPSRSPVCDHSNYASTRAVLSTLLSLHPSSVHIFSSAPCSQTSSVYVPPLMSKTKLHIQAEARTKLVLHILIFTFLDSRQENKRFWTEWLQTLAQFISA